MLIAPVAVGCGVSLDQIVGLALALLLMLVGTAGSVLPGLPGTPLVLAVAIAHRLYFGSTSVNNWVLAGLVLLTLFSVLLDYLAGVWGAKRLGATWRGMVGAVVGAIVGVFLSLPGIILGPFVGALLFELAGGGGLKKATRAGLGTMLGLLAGAVGKFAVCMVMITLFAANVIYRAATM